MLFEAHFIKELSKDHAKRAQPVRLIGIKQLWLSRVDLPVHVEDHALVLAVAGHALHVFAPEKAVSSNRYVARLLLDLVEQIGA